VKLVRTGMPTVQAAAFNGHRSFHDLWRLSRALSASEFDVVLFPTVYSFVPLRSHARKIVMIHDAIAETFPKWNQPSRLGRLFWRAKNVMGRWQADEIVTVSEYSRRTLVERLNLPASRVAVVGEAADPVFRVLDNPQPTPCLKELGLDRDSRQIVYVGGFAPHKNVKTLVEAFAAVAARPGLADLKLVLVGEHLNEVFYSESAALKRHIQERGLENRVIFTGFLPDAELVVLLNLATVFVLPSLMEGFGLPAVEAAACGCPVIVTNASPLPALLGDGAIHFNPYRLRELTEALDRVLTDEPLRQSLGARAHTAAAALTWDAAARQLQEIITR